MRCCLLPGSATVTHNALFFGVTTALKYTKVEQLSLRERLARINTHTLSKKTTRLSQLLKQEAGLVPRVSACWWEKIQGRTQAEVLLDSEVAEAASEGPQRGTPLGSPVLGASLLIRRARLWAWAERQSERFLVAAQAE